MVTATLKFSELVDIAAGHEMGSTNLGVLHAVLHIITTQIGISQKEVEFDGEAAKKVQVLKSKPVPATFLNYQVTESDATGEHEFVSADGKMPVKSIEFKRLENKVRMLASHVEAITMLPATDTMIERMRADPEQTPVTEMIHSVALTKRVSATEEENAKLASLIERLYHDQNRIRIVLKQLFPDVNIDSSQL